MEFSIDFGIEQSTVERIIKAMVGKGLKIDVTNDVTCETPLFHACLKGKFPAKIFQIEWNI